MANDKRSDSQPGTTRGRFLFDLYRATKFGVMPAGCKLVLLTLADHANDQHVAWPSHDALVMSTGASLTQIKSAMDKLITYGWIKVLFQGTGRTSTQYQIAFGRQIPVPKEVSQATARYKRSTHARDVLNRLHAGEISTDQAATELGTLDGDVSASCRAELVDAGLASLVGTTNPGCSQEPPSGSAETPDLLRDLPTDPPNVSSRVCVCGRAGLDSGKVDSSTPSSLPKTKPSPMTTPTSSTKRVDEDKAPTTNRSPTANEATLKTPTSTSQSLPTKPNEPTGSLCSADDLVSWIATRSCFDKLSANPVLLRRWASQQAGEFAHTATRSSDAHASLSKFIHTCGLRIDDMSQEQLFGRLGKWLASAHRFKTSNDYGSDKANNYGKKDRRQPSTPKGGDPSALPQEERDREWAEFFEAENKAREAQSK